MIADRYYFSHLSEQCKTAYKVLYSGILDLKKEIPLQGLSLTLDEIDQVFHAVVADNPFLFYFNQVSLDIKQLGFSKILAPKYFYSRVQVQKYNRQIEKTVNQMMSDLNLTNATDAKKVYKVHEYFCREVSYDHEALLNNQSSRFVESHSIIGVFTNKKAVCEGIAKALKLVLNTAGIKCIIVDGLGGLEEGNHAWNIVKINEGTYHLDMTWDLANSKDGHICYDYYNLSDDDIKRDHSNFHGVPQCNCNEENYFVKNNLDFCNRMQLYKYIRHGMGKGETEYYFRYRGKEGIGTLMPELVKFFSDELPRYDILARIKCSMSESQGTGRIELEEIV